MRLIPGACYRGELKGPSFSPSSLAVLFYVCKVVLVFVGKQPLIPVRRIVPSSPDLVIRGTTELRHNGVLRSSQAPLRGSGDVLPKQLLAPDADRGVAMDQFPFTVLPTEHAGITEGYLRAIG
jgi:hypothetical protein